MQLSAVLLNWRRPYNLPKIVESLRTTKLFSETIIWDNSGTLEPIDGTTIIRSERNLGTYGRRLAAHHAKNDVVYAQDDDHVVENIPEILAAFMSRPDCIAAALNKPHYKVEAGKKPWLQIGWGSFQRREWFDNVKPYIDCYGVDDLLLSKYDRVYTVMHAKHNPIVAKFRRLQGPDGDVSESDKSSLWLQKDHWRLRDEAVSRAIRIRDAAIANPVA